MTNSRRPWWCTATSCTNSPTIFHFFFWPHVLCNYRNRPKLAGRTCLLFAQSLASRFIHAANLSQWIMNSRFMIIVRFTIVVILMFHSWEPMDWRAIGILFLTLCYSKLGIKFLHENPLEFKRKIKKIFKRIFRTERRDIF